MSISFVFTLASLVAAVTASIDIPAHDVDHSALLAHDFSQPWENRRHAEAAHGDADAWQLRESGLLRGVGNDEYSRLDANALLQRHLDWDRFRHSFPPDTGSPSAFTRHEHGKGADRASEEPREKQELKVSHETEGQQNVIFRSMVQHRGWNRRGLAEALHTCKFEATYAVVFIKESIEQLHKIFDTYGNAANAHIGRCICVT
jgi:hypothetical protein